jgi:ABC-2 type transport system ATP-binding protein
MPSVRGVEHKDGTLIISADDVQAVTPQIVRALVEAGAEIMSITPSIPSLEDAYLKLIKEGAGQ